MKEKAAFGGSGWSSGSGQNSGRSETAVCITCPKDPLNRMEWQPLTFWSLFRNTSSVAAFQQWPFNSLPCGKGRLWQFWATVSPFYSARARQKKKKAGHFSQILNVCPQGGFPGMPSASGNVQEHSALKRACRRGRD